MPVTVLPLSYLMGVICLTNSSDAMATFLLGSFDKAIWTLIMYAILLFYLIKSTTRRLAFQVHHFNFISIVQTFRSQCPPSWNYSKSFFVSRLNFTLDDLEVSCPAYTHLLQCIEDLCQGRTENSGTKFFAEQIDVNFPQHLRYERSQYLVRHAYIFLMAWYWRTYGLLYMRL